MKKPILLTKKEFVLPLVQALDRLEEIKNAKTEDDNKIVLEGLFALAVASFEISLIDALGVLFRHIPDRLEPCNEISLKLKDIIEDESLDNVIDTRLRNIASESIRSILLKFIEKARISKSDILDKIDNIIEIKATRNLLLHNNLKINKEYERTAGPLIRKANGHKKLAIDLDYLNYSIETLSVTLTSLKNEIEITYKDYTKLKAIEALFKFVLPTPIMVLDREFYIQLENDTLGGWKKETSMRESLSSSEKFIFGLWLSHSSMIHSDMPMGIFYSLGYKAQEKVALLMRNIDLLKS